VAVTLALLMMMITLASVAAGADRSSADQQEHDPYVEQLIAQITTETLMYELEGLSGERPVTVAGAPYVITTRNTTFADAVSMTTRYAYEQFASSGLDVAYHSYPFYGAYRRNVVAEEPGLVDPERIYLLTAHVDNLPATTDAPGADDNGSGSVAVIEAARLLAPEYFAHTIRFVLFTGEEQGLVGSEAYAADCAARGENIAGVVNLDMIGYSTAEPAFNAFAWAGKTPAASGSRDLADLFSETVAAYSLDLVPHNLVVDRNFIMRSDQWSFLQQGYPAFLVIEDAAGGDFNPFCHTRYDTVDAINWAYFAELTRAAVATVADLGGRLSSGTLSGTVRIGDAGYHPTVTITAEDPAYVTPFSITATAGTGYAAQLPVGSYTITVRPDSPRYTPVVTRALILTDTVTSLDVRLPGAMVLYLPLTARTADWAP
jgi:hypothetical protein